MSPEIREAATVILVRQRNTLPEVFMLERPSRGDFPELHVFPGGKVDADDATLASEYGELYERSAWGIGAPTKFAVAAVRECFEEAGVLFVKSRSNAQHTLDLGESHREELLRANLSFAEFLTQESLEIDFSGVHYFSHWITPAGAPARFNARFFVARLPHRQDASHHLSETSNGSWVSPAQALRNYAHKRWQMIVPTLTSLRMISGYNNVDDLIRDVVRGRHRIPVTPALHTQGMQFFELE